MLDQLARIALAEVADKRATFTRGNVLAEVHRQLQGIRFATAERPDRGRRHHHRRAPSDTP